MFDTLEQMKKYLSYIKPGTRINMIINGLFSGSRIETPVNAEYIEHSEDWVRVRMKFRHDKTVYRFEEVDSIGGGWK